jgi:hypothetical protein
MNAELLKNTRSGSSAAPRSILSLMKAATLNSIEAALGWTIDRLLNFGSWMRRKRSDRNNDPWDANNTPVNE